MAREFLLEHPQYLYARFIAVFFDVKAAVCF